MKAINKDEDKVVAKMGFIERVLRFRWVPSALRDIKFLGLILSFWILTAIFFLGLYYMLSYGGTTYRWVLIGIFFLLVCILILGLAKEKVQTRERI